MYRSDIVRLKTYILFYLHTKLFVVVMQEPLYRWVKLYTFFLYIWLLLFVCRSQVKHGEFFFSLPFFKHFVAAYMLTQTTSKQSHHFGVNMME